MSEKENPRRLGEQAPLAVAQERAALQLIKALDPPGRPVLPLRLRHLGQGRQHRHPLHRPLPLRREGLRFQGQTLSHSHRSSPRISPAYAPEGEAVTRAGVFPENFLQSPLYFHALKG